MLHELAVRRCLPELMVASAILLMGWRTEMPTVGNDGNNQTDSNSGNPLHNRERGNANHRTSPGKTNPRVVGHLLVDSPRMVTTDTVDGN